MENSFHSRGSKNFVLKSDYLNSSRHGSKKNLSSFVDPNLNNQNQKSLFKAGSFLTKKMMILEKIEFICQTKS